MGQRREPPPLPPALGSSSRGPSPTPMKARGQAAARDLAREESEMVETNSTDEERGGGARPITGRAERRESPPREYVGG
ncbi:hypothetical protein CRUP_027350 [Coryphaenoides rupestris]|nr:hypothetical protein CRUP_027350 [Coryphaenoides rupestris]